MRCFIAVMSVLVVASGTLFPSTLECAELQIKYLGAASDVCFVKTDNPCGVLHVVWNAGDGPHFREEDGPRGAASAGIDMVVPRQTCWRMDFGAKDDFDWNVIREALRLFYGKEIGATSMCDVQVAAKAIPCYDVTMAVYTAYTRHVYRIQKGDRVAAVSVLEPAHGTARVYYDVRRLLDGDCAYASAPTLLSNGGLCAGVDGVPFAGECANGGGKGDIQDEPRLPIPGDDLKGHEATWGGIKALFE